MPVTYYDSLSAFQASLPEKIKGGHDGWSAPSEFNEYTSYARAREMITAGYPSVVSRAAKMIDKIEAATMETPMMQIDRSIAGFIPDVPSYLAGAPDSMLTMRSVQSDASPIKVYASCATSGGLTTEQIENRGLAILALCQKLQAVRPVELFLFEEMDARGLGKEATGIKNIACPVIRIGTSPIDLATAAYLFAHPAFQRSCVFAWGYDGRGFTGGWAWGLPPGEEEAAKNRREVFGLSENDLVVPGAYLYDKVVQDPIGWVNDQLTIYAAVKEETYE